MSSLSRIPLVEKNRNPMSPFQPPAMGTASRNSNDENRSQNHQLVPSETLQKRRRQHVLPFSNRQLLDVPSEPLKKQRHVLHQQKHREKNFEVVRAREFEQNHERVSNQDKRSKRNAEQKNRYQQQKDKGNTKKPGINRVLLNESVRYKARNVMKRGVCVLRYLYGERWIYNNYLIDLLDGIRSRFDHGEGTLDAYKSPSKYQRPEYFRCIQAFLEKDGKQWKPKEGFELTQEQLERGVAFRRGRKWKEIRPEIIEIVFDDTLMKECKALADMTDFASWE